MVDLNCDMGEGFGIYSFANDEEIMPFIDVANVACGFHASDPNTMRKTVQLAKKYNVKVGAHPAFPDLVGFGRRPMKMSREEIKNLVMYQTGALKSFLDEINMPLNHIKPHGSLYGVSAKEEDVAQGIADAIQSHDGRPVTFLGFGACCCVVFRCAASQRALVQRSLPLLIRIGLCTARQVQ